MDQKYRIPCGAEISNSLWSRNIEVGGSVQVFTVVLLGGGESGVLPFKESSGFSSLDLRLTSQGDQDLGMILQESSDGFPRSNSALRQVFLCPKTLFGLFCLRSPRVFPENLPRH